MYNLKRAIYHVKQADMWLAMYDKEQTATRRIVLEHHIGLARYHVAIVKGKDI